MNARLRAALLFPLLLAILLLGGTQCTTLHYAGIQNDFEHAVAEEITVSESPFVDRYQTISATLTDSYILRLDPKLKPNAWMLRALSQWRSGDWEGARTSASNGLKADPIPGSRDLVVLSMIDSLTIVTELERKAAATGSGGVPASDYANGYEAALKEAWTALDEVNRAFGPATPNAVKDYWHYQKWRYTVAWREIIRHIQGEPALRNNARERAAKFLGRSLEDEGEAAKSRISENSPLLGRMR